MKKSKVISVREKLYGKADFDRLTIQMLKDGNLWIGMHGGAEFEIIFKRGTTMVLFSADYENACPGCYKKEIIRREMAPPPNKKKNALIEYVFDQLKLPLKYYGDRLPEYYSKNTVLCDFSGWQPDWTNMAIAAYGPYGLYCPPSEKSMTMLAIEMSWSGWQGSLYFQREWTAGFILLYREGNKLFPRKTDTNIQELFRPGHKERSWHWYQIDVCSDQPAIAFDHYVWKTRCPTYMNRSYPSLASAIAETHDYLPYASGLIQVDDWEGAKSYMKRRNMFRW